MGKPRIKASSVRWLVEIDRAIRQYNIRGPVARFTDIAADVLDGWATRQELDDLIRRGLLCVVRYKRCEVDHWFGVSDDRLCGTKWSVNLTESAIRAFWPERIRAALKEHRNA